MTTNQILLKESAPAKKAALAFAHSFNHGNHKVLNLVGPVSDGLTLAKSVYNYIKSVSADILFVTGEELRNAMITSVTLSLCKNSSWAKALRFYPKFARA